MSHTPAPWYAKRKTQGDYEHLYICHDDPMLSCIVADLHSPTLKAADGTVTTNARKRDDAALICAAPDLLGKLDELAGWARDHDAGEAGRAAADALARLVEGADKAMAAARGDTSIRLPGQWTVERKVQSDYEHLYVCEETPTVARIVADLHCPVSKHADGRVTTRLDKLSNASLIANAPCLAAALEAIVDWACEHTGPRDPGSPHDLLVAARDLLALARGRVAVEGAVEMGADDLRAIGLM
jgi:hypothetical protein